MKTSQLEVDAARNASVQSGVLVAGLCWGGSTCDAPRDAPSSVQAQQQPSGLRCESRPQVCIHAGSGAGPLCLRARAQGFARLKSRLQKATSSYWYFRKTERRFHQ